MDELLTKDFLSSLGIELDDQTYNAFNEYYESTLNERIIDAITDELDEYQLDDLSKLKNADKQLVQDWLITNIPSLDEIIQTEIAIVMGDIAENADSI